MEKNKMKKVIGIFVAMVLLLLAVTVASAGQTSEQLGNAGWDCETVGIGVHCVPPPVDFPEDVGKGERAAIPVKVFSNDGSTFFGTELLIREDLYLKGKSQSPRPCPQDGLDEYAEVGNYRACHHFDTGGH